MAESALVRLEELVEEEWVREDPAERVRGLYNYRRNRFAARWTATTRTGSKNAPPPTSVC